MFRFFLCFTLITVFGFIPREVERELASRTDVLYPTDCLEELRVYMNFSNWVNNDDYEAMFLSNTWGMKGMGNYEQCKLHQGSFCMDTVGSQFLCSSEVIAGNGCCIPKSCEGSSIEKQVAALFCTPVQESTAIAKVLERLNITKNITIDGIPLDTIIDLLAKLPVVSFGAKQITCGDYSKSFTTGSICWTLFIFILIGLVLLASLPKYIHSVYFPHHEETEINAQAEATMIVHRGQPVAEYSQDKEASTTVHKTHSTESGGIIKNESLAYKSKNNPILQAFNFYENWTSLVTFVPRKTSFLDGIRFWSFAWVVLGHSAICQGFMGFDNIETIITQYAPHQLWFTIFEAQGLLAVDTFFWLGSMLTGYLLPKKLMKQRVRFRDFWYFVPVLIVRRWLRIMPACLFVLICFWQLFPLMTFGPKGVGQILEFSANQCSKAWWRYLFNIAAVESPNIDYSLMLCQGWYWYMQSEMIMYYIAVIIVAFYILNKYIAIGMSAFCALLFTIVAWTQAWVTHQSYGGMFYYHVWPGSTPAAEAGLYYFRFWNRAGIYFVGLTVGFIFRELDEKKHKIGPWMSSFLQLFSCLLLFLICSILFTDITGPTKDHKWFNMIGKAGWTNMGEATYLGLARPAWGLGLSVLSYSFIYNKGKKGFFNRMLSLPIYAPLGKLTFVGYLIHLDWIQLYGATQAGLWEHYTTISQVRNFFGYMSIALLSAFVITMICELPFARLVALLFEGNRSKGRVNKKLDVNEGQYKALLHD